MKKALKDLQERYSKGEIKKGQYIVELEKLVEDETITQDEADDAESYDPEAEKPIYTQADYDSTIAKRVTQQIRKILKDAGVEVDANNKDLSGKVVELVKIGAGKVQAPENTDPDAAKAAAQQASRIVELMASLKTTRLENAALKVAGKYNPVSQAAVIAMLKSDYAHEIEYLDEDTGEIDHKSIDRVMKRMQLNDPELFRKDDQSKGDDTGKPGSGFQGKGPGGNGNAGEGGNQNAKLAEMRQLMGIKSETTK